MKNKDLEKCFSMIDPKWDKQCASLDKKTALVLKLKSFDDVLKCSEDDKDNLQYILHRWYNKSTTENLLTLLKKNPKTSSFVFKKRLIIDDLPYAIHLTIYPQKLREEKRFLNVSNKKEKQELIKWLFDNRSKDTRKFESQILYVVCYTDNEKDDLRLKMDSLKIANEIVKYFSIKNSFENSIESFIDINGYPIYADLITITN